MAPRGIVHTCGDLFRLPTSPFHRAGTACQCVAWFHHQSYRPAKSFSCCGYDTCRPVDCPANCVSKSGAVITRPRVCTCISCLITFTACRESHQVLFYRFHDTVFITLRQATVWITRTKIQSLNIGCLILIRSIKYILITKLII